MIRISLSGSSSDRVRHFASLPVVSSTGTGFKGNPRFRCRTRVNGSLSGASLPDQSSLPDGLKGSSPQPIDQTHAAGSSEKQKQGPNGQRPQPGRVEHGRTPCWPLRNSSGRTKPGRNEQMNDGASNDSGVDEKPLIVPNDWEERLRNALRVEHYAYRTEQTYLSWADRFLEAEVQIRRENSEMLALIFPGAPKHFLEDLATRKRVSASTQNQALSALLFLYRALWDKDLEKLTGTVRARKSQRLPTVLSSQETRRVLRALSGTNRLVGDMLYGCGLRLQECITLRIKDIDFSRGMVEVRSGKGGKDRFVMLPESIVPDLRRPPRICADHLGT